MNNVVGANCRRNKNLFFQFWIVFLTIFILLSCSFKSPDKYDRSTRDYPEGYNQVGIASWYGDKEHGRKTASGEVFNRNAYTAAHQTLPFGTMVRVTNLENGRDVIVEVNDRGPFVRGRIIDLSYASAKSVGLYKTGVAKVKIEVISSPSTRKDSYFKPLYTVQVGSFSSKVNAFTVQRDLDEMLKNEVRIEPVEFKGDTYYRVRVGMFSTRKDAESLRKKLVKYGYNGKVLLE